MISLIRFPVPCSIPLVQLRSGAARFGFTACNCSATCWMASEGVTKTMRSASRQRAISLVTSTDGGISTPGRYVSLTRVVRSRPARSALCPHSTTWCPFCAQRTASAVPNWKSMAHNRERCGCNAEILRVRSSNPVCGKNRQPNGQKTFERINKKHGVTIGLPEHAQDVSRANVATSMLADIHAGGSTGQISRRKRSEKVADQADRAEHDDHLVGNS